VPRRLWVDPGMVSTAFAQGLVVHDDDGYWRNTSNGYVTLRGTPGYGLRVAPGERFFIEPRRSIEIDPDLFERETSWGHLQQPPPEYFGALYLNVSDHVVTVGGTATMAYNVEPGEMFYIIQPVQPVQVSYRRIVCEPALLLAAWERNEIAPQGGFLWYNFSREFVTVGHDGDDFPYVVEPGQSFYTANDPQIRAVDRLALLANRQMVRQAVGSGPWPGFADNTWRNSSDLVVRVGNEAIQPNEAFHALSPTWVGTAGTPELPETDPTPELDAHIRQEAVRIVASTPIEDFTVTALGNGNYKVEILVTADRVSPLPEVTRSKWDVLGDFLV